MVKSRTESTAQIGSLWNPLPKTGLCGIHCPKWVVMESTAQNGSLWNPLPKTGLCGIHCPNWVWCYLPWRTHPISHCLSSSLKDKPWVALTFILLRICFVGGGWSPSWKKKDYTWKMVKCRTESTAQIGSDTIYLEECQKNSFFTLWTQRVCEWQCWNFRIFFFTLFLHFTWILFWSFWKPKNCHFAFWPF